MRFTLDSSVDNQEPVFPDDDVEEQAMSETTTIRSSSCKRRALRRVNSSSSSSKVGPPRIPPMSSLRVVSVILILGVAAAGCFWSMGVLSALSDSETILIRDAEHVADLLRASFRDYENAALVVQQSCRSHKRQQQQQQQDTNTTSRNYPSDFRSFFRDIYEEVVASGLQVYSVQYVPNVTHSQRAWYEQEALAFYQQHYPSVAAEYKGFVRAAATDNGTVATASLPQQPFYFPIHFVEPVLDNVPIIDMDLYDTQSSREVIQSAIQTKQSHVTQRLRLLQDEPSIETDNAYSVLLIHPGINTTRPYDDHTPDHHEVIVDNTDIALVVIRIRDLFQYMTLQDRRYETQDTYASSIKVYLYDSTPDDDPLQPTRQFLGAVCLKHFDELQDNHHQHELEYLPEIGLEKLMANTTIQLHVETLNLGQRQWTMACVVEQRTYTSSPMLAILAGTMILIAFIGLAMWIHGMMNRAALASKLKAKSQEEQAILRIQHARQAAAAERQLNEFIAHEVRNPLAAAMSACSFVSSVLQEEVEKSCTLRQQLPLSTSSACNPPPQPRCHNKRPSPLFSLSASSNAPQQPEEHQQQQSQRPTPSPLFAITTTSKQTNTTRSQQGESTESTSLTASESSSASESLNGTCIPSPLFSLAPRAAALCTQRGLREEDEPSMDNNISSPSPLFSLITDSTEEPHIRSQAQEEYTKKDVHSAPNGPLFSIPPTAPSSSRAPAPAPIVADEDARKSVVADLHIIDSSLQFINDLLRNMLDVQRAACHQLTIEKGPTDILRDILEPVDAMLYLRGRNVEVQLDCGLHANLLVETDRLRLKQVVLNLGRNAAKFVERGHVRFRVVVVPGKTPHPDQTPANGIRSSGSFIEQAEPTPETVQIWIEDTGPGIPADKRAKLFAKFQESLDTLAQGTGKL
jgi:signal transduction histidine kinase